MHKQRGTSIGRGQISTTFSQIKKPNWCSVLALVNFRGRAVAIPLPCPAPSRADITACLPLRPVILSRVPWYRLTIIIMVCGNSAIGSQTHHNSIRDVVSPFKTLERFTGRGIAGQALKRLRTALSGSSDVLSVARYRRTASVLLVSWGV